MNMKKTAIQSAVLLAIGSSGSLVMGTAQAATTLNMNAGFYFCGPGGVLSGSTCDFSIVVPGLTAPAQVGGSFFGMDANGGGIADFEKTPIIGKAGITLDAVQAASGSHTGAPFGAANSYTGTNFIQIGQDTTTNPATPIYIDAGASGACLTNPANCTSVGDTTTDTATAFVATTTEVPGIDEPWAFFGNTGMHFTIGDGVNAVGGSGTTRLLDFSDWRVTWNGIPSINMGGGNPAVMTCSSVDCKDGDTYTLLYDAVVPVGDPSGFGGVPYQLSLEGTISGDSISAIPVPAAVWLFGSGLLGLVGVARRKKVASAI